MCEITEKREKYPPLIEVKEKVHKQKLMDFKQIGDDVLRYQGRLSVRKVEQPQQMIMKENHSSRYLIHPLYTYMYNEYWEVYRWINRRMFVIADFIAKYTNCQ